MLLCLGFRGSELRFLDHLHTSMQSFVQMSCARNEGHNGIAVLEAWVGSWPLRSMRKSESIVKSG